MKKKYPYLILLLLCLLSVTGLSASTVWDGTSDISWYNTTDTEFEITTAEELAGLAEIVNGIAASVDNFSGKTIKLGDDIQLNDISNWKNWETVPPLNYWTSIGTEQFPFQGTFDGSGHAISGIYINNDNNYQGLFGAIDNGHIYNLAVTESYIKGKDNVGGLVGNINTSTISNCSSGATVVAAGDDSLAGGLVGFNNSGNILNCYVYGKVKAIGNDAVIGGLVGSSDGNITSSYYNLTVNVGLAGVGKGPLDGVFFKTTIEMQSSAFALLLNIWVKFSGDDNLLYWEALDGGYPVPQLTDFTFFDAGDGSETSPYEIATATQLETMSFLVNNYYNLYSSAHYKLTADIALNDTDDWELWELWGGWDINFWTPIGTGRFPFLGIFDGSGHTISGIYVNSNTGDSGYGLFGTIVNAYIHNLAVTKSYIKGSCNVGGLAGNVLASTVLNCSSGATVVVVGDNSRVGGLVGVNNGRILNCFAYGKVKAMGNDAYFGGLLGVNSGSVISSYCDSAVNVGLRGVGLGSSYGITPKTTVEMQSSAFTHLLNIGVELIGDDNLLYWEAVDGGYPVPQLTDFTFFDAGDGSETSPYEIATATQLETMSFLVNNYYNLYGSAHYKLTADIALNDTDDWESWGEENEGNITAPSNHWTPIGTEQFPFQGTFDGSGHTISGIYVNNDNNYQGLFGTIVNARIHNLAVTKSYIKGYECAGSLASYSMDSNLINCSSGATVVAAGDDSLAGGLVGINEGSIFNCYTYGKVNATGNYALIGGLVGVNTSTISNCSSGATVVAAGDGSLAGGLVGINEGSIFNCYAYGKVNATVNDDVVGGLVGVNQGSVTSSYYDSAVNVGLIGMGSGLSDGITPKTTVEMQSPGFARELNENISNLSDDENPLCMRWINLPGQYPAFAIQWTGEKNASWDDADNWLPKTAPNEHNVWIPAVEADAYYPVLDVTGTAPVDNILLEMGAQLGNQNYLNYNKAFVEMDYSLFGINRYYFLTAPLQDMVAGDLFLGGKPDVWVRYAEAIGSSISGSEGVDYPISELSLTKNLPDYAIDLVPGFGVAYRVDAGSESYVGLENKDNKLILPRFEAEKDGYDPEAASYSSDNYGYNQHEVWDAANSKSDFYYYYVGKPDTRADVTKYHDSKTRSFYNQEKGIYKGNRFMSELLTEENNYSLVLGNSNGDDNDVLLGNPYLAALDLSKFYSGNSEGIENYFRFYEDGNVIDYYISDSEAYTTSTTVMTDPLVAPMQAFFVKPKAGTSEVKMLPSMTTAEKTVSLRSGASKKKAELRVGITQNGQTSSALILCSETITGNGVPEMLPEDKSIPSVYVYGDQFILSIAEIDKEVRSVALGVQTGSEKEFTLSLGGIENFEDTDIYLYDAYNNQKLAVTESKASYSFAVTPDMKNRFQILFSTKGMTSMQDMKGFVRVFKQEDAIHITSHPGDRIEAVTVYNVQGQRVLSVDRINEVNYRIDLVLENTVYLVEVKTANGVSTHKVK